MPAIQHPEPEGAEQFNVHEAKTRLSELLVRVENGEDIVIARAGKPVARLARVAPRRRLETGFLNLNIPVDALLEPMSEEELAEWERPISSTPT